MEEKRAIFLYNTISSFISYVNFLEEDGTNTKYLKDIDFDILMGVYTSLIFAKDIDKHIEKKENDNGRILLCPNAVEDFACLLSEKTNTGYKIGDLYYKSADTLLIKIRNKLAHCDFVVEDGKIVFSENNVFGKIAINDLVYAYYKLKNYLETVSLYMPYKRVYTDFSNSGSTNAFTSFDAYAKNIRIATLSSVVKSGCERTLKDAIFYDRLCSNLLHYFKKQGINKQSVANMKKYIINLTTGSNVTVDLNLSSLRDVSYYEAVKKHYENEKDLIDSVPIEIQIKYLSDIIMKKSKTNKNFNTVVGLQLNFEYIYNLKNGDVLTFSDFCNKKKIASLNSDIMLIVNLLAGFYAIYQMGLEDGFTNHTVYDINNLLNGKNLNFSLLDATSALSDTCSFEFKNQSDVLIHQNCLIAKLEERLIACQNNLDKYIEAKKNGEIDNDVLKKLENFINITQKNLDEAINYKFIMLKYFWGINREHFAENFGTITCIRNSIVHSNEELVDNGELLDEKKLCFKVVNEDKCCYSKTVTVGEFKSLFNYNNMIVLMEYLKYNITDKSKINENILEDIYNEQLKRTKSL